MKFPRSGKSVTEILQRRLRWLRLSLLLQGLQSAEIIDVRVATNAQSGEDHVAVKTVTTSKLTNCSGSNGVVEGYVESNC